MIIYYWLLTFTLSLALQEGVGGAAPRSSSLRYSRANGSTHTSLGSRPSTGEPTPAKKSNWEVIEHYSKSGLVGASSSKSPTEEEAPKEDDEDVESILESTGKWWNLCALCHRVFLRSHQFKNIHVEVLYQRYFLRMNQSSMVSLLGLMLVVVLVMFCLTYILDISKFKVQAITLAATAVLYVVLEVLLWRTQLLNEVYLIIFSYLVLVSFFGLEVLVTLSSQPATASAGVWATLFFIYMTYTLLPLRVPEATVGGLLLALTHVTCTVTAKTITPPFFWKQVSHILFVELCFTDNSFKPFSFQSRILYFILANARQLYSRLGRTSNGLNIQMIRVYMMLIYLCTVPCVKVTYFLACLEHFPSYQSLQQSS